MESDRLPQALKIDPPNEITFHGPYNTVIESTLKLANPTTKQVAFKVKTTAPKQYCVRPNSGFIEPGEERSVVVMLQPLADGKPSAETSKHKFLVQTCFVPHGETSIDTMWKNMKPEELMDSKLRVSFDGGVAQPTNRDSSATATNISLTSATGSDFKKATGGGNTESELRKALDLLQRANDEKQTMARENQQLRAQMERSGGRGAVSSNGNLQLKQWQAIVAALVAVLLGIIIAKIIF